MVLILPSLRRLGFTTALGLAMPVLPAFAQNAAPPARVGQITALAGSVSFNGSGSGGWAAAVDNYPVTAGDSLYTQDNARAGIALDASQIMLSSDTELQVTGLDEKNFAATLAQGEAALAVSDLQPGQVFTISTPRGAVGISQNGQYDIIAGDANTPTTVNVYQGAATISDPGLSLRVNAGQAGILSGTGQTTAQLGQARQDSFTSMVLAENTAPLPAYAPAITSQMTGIAELGQYGSWAQSPQYGALWYPTVAAGWTPYREGYWAYIPPWGWTWVESEPWGFAPFHYGRWVDADGRWAWAPAPAYIAGDYGPFYQPVYAPAVVSFFGVALAAGITAALLSSGSIGWVPLAPNEPYYPPYYAPPAYIRQINIVNVRDIGMVHTTGHYYYGNTFPPGRFANHRAAIFVPADVMRRGEPVAFHAHRPPPNLLATARPIDTGFGHAPAGATAFRLPQASQPMAALHPGIAPHPPEFAERHILPPATLSHTGFAGHPGETPPPHVMSGAMPASHPGFATAPGYHAPPAPPAPGQHPGILPPAGNFHPEMENHVPQSFHPPMAQHSGMAPPFHPPAEAFHSPPQFSHPAPEHAPAQGFRPPMPAFHPPAEQFHPPAPAFHPPAGQFHPPAMAQPRPMEAPGHFEPHGDPGHGGGDWHQS